MPKFSSRMHAASDERIAPGALDDNIGKQYEAGRLIGIDYAPDGSYADLTFEAARVNFAAAEELHTPNVPATPGEHDQESD